MSNIINLVVEKEVNSCNTREELEIIQEKYARAFNNAVDAQKFNRLIQAKFIKLDQS